LPLTILASTGESKNATCIYLFNVDQKTKDLSVNKTTKCGYLISVSIVRVGTLQEINNLMSVIDHFNIKHSINKNTFP